jgi:hypothetical protein
MTLLERLNHKCDALAKSAVSLGIINCPEIVTTARPRLLLESVALFHNGVKISGECGREIRFQIGKVEARDFYINHLGCRGEHPRNEHFYMMTYGYKNCS